MPSKIIKGLKQAVRHARGQTAKAGAEPTRLTDYDILVLRELNGENPQGLVWGAGMSVSISFLKNRGYVETRVTPGLVEYVITDKGRQALEQAR